jgi:hypothetical protein
MDRQKFGAGMLKGVSIFKIGLFVVLMVVILTSSDFTGVNRFFAILLVWIYYQIDSTQTELYNIRKYLKRKV